MGGIFVSPRLALALALVLVAGACTSSKPREATDAELAPVDVDASGQPLRAPPTTPAPSSSTSPGTSPSTDSGPIATLIYVCEIRDEGRVRPAAVIFSSDPESPWLNERPRPSRILKPMQGWKMAQLLADLRKAGLDTLPKQDEKADDRIEGDRQFMILSGARRANYRKLACKQDKVLYETFARCERILVSYSAGTDTFVETEGLAPIPGH